MAICSSCGGTKKCSSCGGTGKVPKSNDPPPAGVIPDFSDPPSCMACVGTGKCLSCKDEQNEKGYFMNGGTSRI